MVGVTSTDITYSIAFAYVESERSDNYVWVLSCLKHLIVSENGQPKVFVSDRDLALMNALNEVFPQSKHLLCQFHIDKNVQAKCKVLVHKKDCWDMIFNVWKFVVESPTEEDYNKRVSYFELVCKEFKPFFEYCMKTWLTPHKECFVDAWVDKVMHLGNTTTNRYGDLVNYAQFMF